MDYCKMGLLTFWVFETTRPQWSQVSKIEKINISWWNPRRVSPPKLLSDLWLVSHLKSAISFCCPEIPAEKAQAFGQISQEPVPINETYSLSSPRVGELSWQLLKLARICQSKGTIYIDFILCEVLRFLFRCPQAVTLYITWLRSSEPRAKHSCSCAVHSISFVKDFWVFKSTRTNNKDEQEPTSQLP